MNDDRRSQESGFLLALPSIIWLSVFFLLPLASIVVFSFLSRGQGGTAVLPFTLDSYNDMFFGSYNLILVRSLRIALTTTVICFFIGYPLAFFISTRQNNWVRQLTLFMVILPFWTNFLVRTYAWRIILGQEGTLNGFLQWIGVISEPLQMLNTELAVIIGLVYGFLPFMVLPVYASVERFNFRFVEAAHDLGANDWKAFWRVVFPMTLPGVVAGTALVFIPSIGAYVTPDLLGGTRGLMIGNLIQRQFVGSGNVPRGSAFSMVLMGLVMLALIFYVIFNARNSEN
ncbi:MAG: ABC transporter permease [Phototrophicaceae bacterium]